MSVYPALDEYLREMVQQHYWTKPEDIRSYRPTPRPDFQFAFPTMTSTKQESKPMAHHDQNETEQIIDKGRLANNPTITATSNGGFIVSSGNYDGYDRQAFTNADDLMAYLRIEAKKFTEGHEAQIAARKAAAKKAG